jgi:hypothetical protein
MLSLVQPNSALSCETVAPLAHVVAAIFRTPWADLSGMAGGTTASLNILPSPATFFGFSGVIK